MHRFIIAIVASWVIFLASALAQNTEAEKLDIKIEELSLSGHYSQAIPLAKELLAKRERAFGRNHPDVAKSLHNLALLYQLQLHYAEAEPLYKRAIAIRERSYGPDHPLVAPPLINLGDIYEKEGRYAEGARLLERALAIEEKALGPDHSLVATLQQNLATLYAHQHRYVEAEPLARRSLAIRERVLGPDSLDVADSLIVLAALQIDQGRYTDAEPLCNRALAIKEKVLGPDDPQVALILNNLAQLYGKEGRYMEAEPLYTRSLAINEAALGPDHPDVARSLGVLADLYKEEGRYRDAELLVKRSLAIQEKIPDLDRRELADALVVLGNIYEEQSLYADAEAVYRRSLSIMEKLLDADDPAIGTLLGNLAILYGKQGRYEEAVALATRSLTVQEKALGPGHPNVAQSLQILGNFFEDEGRYADADASLKRALTIREKALGSDHAHVAYSLDDLARMYKRQGKYRKSEIFYRRSLAITETALGVDHPELVSSLNNLAVLLQEEHRYAEAEPLFKRALALAEKVLEPTHQLVSELSNNLASLYEGEDRLTDAVSIVRRTILQNTAKKYVALNVLYGSQSKNLISPAELLGNSYTVFQRSSASAASQAVSKLAVRFGAGSSELAQLVRKDQDLAAESERLDKNIIAAVSKPPAERNATAEEQTRKRIAEIRSEQQQLQEVFEKRFPDYAALSKPKPISIEETQGLLADDEALIAVDLDKQSYGWVVTRNRAEWRQLPISADEVVKEVAALRAGLNPDLVGPFDRNLAYRLYQKILGPIADVIAEKTRLSFVLSGALTSLPPQVLITSDPEGKGSASTDWLVRKYAITVLPSVASLRVLRGKDVIAAAIKPLIGFGDPVFDKAARTATKRQVGFSQSLTNFYRGVTADTTALARALPALPETADELRAVAKQLGAKPEDVKLGEAASVTEVKHERLDNYRVVYFATHALVAGEVEKFAKVKAEPALVLSIPDKPSDEDDGLLRASDVALLKMNADFVVLSACNTAAGDKPGAEALSGLARAFFYAGAKSLIVSNWEVDSESTVALMTGLFDVGKANPHLSHAEALRLSILRMIANPSKPEWAQPTFWAPFIVVGEPQKT